MDINLMEAQPNDIVWIKRFLWPKKVVIKKIDINAAGTMMCGAPPLITINDKYKVNWNGTKLRLGTTEIIKLVKGKRPFNIKRDVEQGIAETRYI